MSENADNGWRNLRGEQGTFVIQAGMIPVI